VASGIFFDALTDLQGRHQQGEGMVNGVWRVGGGEWRVASGEWGLLIGLVSNESATVYYWSLSIKSCEYF